jgi:solute carrier family 25 folate transporter 32
MARRDAAAVPTASDAARALAGAAAGAVASCVCSPLDVAKTRIQMRGVFATSNVAAARFTTISSSLRLIYAEEGGRGLYRGLSATLSTVPLFYFAFFPVYERAKARISSTAALNERGVNVLAAILAGGLADSLTNPLWVIRTRMQTSYMHNPAAPNLNVLQMGRTILRSEGAAAFYKGFGASLLGLSHVAIQLPVYEELKTRVETGAAWLDVLVAAALSKLAATLVTYPHETIRTRLQDQRGRAGAADRRYRGLFNCASVIVRDEGVRGLYAGLRVNVVRVVPAAITTFAVYESIVKVCRERA